MVFWSRRSEGAAVLPSQIGTPRPPPHSASGLRRAIYRRDEERWADGPEGAKRTVRGLPVLFVAVGPPRIDGASEREGCCWPGTGVSEGG